MTKVEAIERVLRDNGGAASLSYIYDNIEHYYPGVKEPREWEAGIRGVLYRDVGKRFKRVGLSLYAIADYEEEKTPKKDKVRMHSFIEGICIEWGNTISHRINTTHYKLNKLFCQKSQKQKKIIKKVYKN